MDALSAISTTRLPVVLIKKNTYLEVRESELYPKKNIDKDKSIPTNTTRQKIILFHFSFLFGCLKDFQPC
jgi:hypothetical protein